MVLTAIYGDTVMSKGKNTGLDGRHRDVNGEIDRRHGNTLVGTLRDTYGPGFAEGRRSDMKLGNLLAETGSRSLSDYLKRKP
jgi:hypothetical protein